MSRAIKGASPTTPSRGRRRPTVPTKLKDLLGDDNSLSGAISISEPKRETPRRRPAIYHAEPVVCPQDGNSLSESMSGSSTKTRTTRRRSAKPTTTPVLSTPTGNYSEDAIAAPKPMPPARPRRRSIPPTETTVDPSDGNSLAGHGPHAHHARPARLAKCDQDAGATPDTHSNRASWSHLALYSAAVDDIERTRIALRQRALAFIRDGAPETHPDVLLLVQLSVDMEKIEKQAIKRLEYGVYKETGLLGAWVKATNGLGAKTVGRFLGCVGNPRIKPVRGEEDPETGKRPIIGYTDRTVSQLWAYCGLDVREGKAPKLARGTKANWNGIARKRAFCMAEPCIKNMNSEYRSVYDAARLKYADAEISDLHKHRRAMRAVMKAIVKDLWVNAGATALPQAHPVLAPSSPTPNQGGAGHQARDNRPNSARAAKEVANA